MRHITTPAQHRFDADAFAFVDQGDHAGREAVLTEDAAHQICTPLAIEHGFQQLDGAHRIRAPMGEIILQAHGNGRRATQLVPVRNIEGVVGQQS
ncbi:hypothetical protein D3C81_1040630 [compost metagenome]